MMVDLSFMKRDRVAVNCRTSEELKALTDAIAEEYPAYSRVFQTKYKCWTFDHDSEGMSIRAKLLPDENIDYGHCYASYYRNCGYEVIEFSAISTQLDFGEIEPCHINADEALSALF